MDVVSKLTEEGLVMVNFNYVIGRHKNAGISGSVYDSISRMKR
jgi:hypothetical protein